MSGIDLNSQFAWTYEDFLDRIDFDNWYYFLLVIKELIALRPRSVLEIGAGSEVIKNLSCRFIPDYKVMDINPELNPDFVCDLRDFQPRLERKFDCVVCTEVLEHCPFYDLDKGLANIRKYLTEIGKVIITVPHQRYYFLFITANRAHSFTLPIWVTPRDFYRRFIKKHLSIDPYHYWEIGNGKIGKVDFEQLLKRAGFRVDKFIKALYADLFVLSR